MKLEQWGQWRVKQMEGKGKAFCEDVMGEILVIERAYLYVYKGYGAK